MSTSPLDWYPQPTGDNAMDFAIRTAFENLYTLRNQMNAAHAKIPAPAPSFADISKALTGSAPNALNVTGLPGTLSQPQPAKIVASGNTLPPASSAVDGQLGWLNGIAYRYDAATKKWVPLNGAFLYGTRAQRQNHVLFPQFDPTNLAPGTPYFETDSGLTYMVQPDPYVVGNPSQWFYQDGVAVMYWPYRNAPGGQWPGTGVLASWNYTDLYAKLWITDQAPGSASQTGKLDYLVLFATGTPGPAGVYDSYYQSGIYFEATAPRPITIPSTPSSPLLAFDAGFTTFCANCGHTWIWTTSLSWTWASGEGAGGTEDGPVAPNPGTGWWQQVPVAGGTITVADASGGPGTPFTYPAYTSYNTLNPGWFKYARL